MTIKKYFLITKLLRDALSFDKSVFTISNGPSVCEAKSDKNYPITVNEQWVTIGNEKKPWHIHLDLTTISEAKFIEEPGCVGQSYSLRLFDSDGTCIARIYFSDSNDKDGKILVKREAKYRKMISQYNDTTHIKLTGE